MASELQVGKVGVGVTPSQHLHIDDSTKANILLTKSAGVADSTTEMGTVFFGNHDTSKYLCAINGVQDGVKASGKLTFATQPDGGSRTTRMTIDSAGNLGLGVVPNDGWSSLYSALQISTLGAIYQASNYEDLNVANNAYSDAGTDKYIQADAACKIRLTDAGLMDFKVAGAGLADAAIPWVTALSIDSTGLATFNNGISVTTGGIKFPATQSASADANTLDDYEEGTWTPVLKSGSTTITLSGGNQSSTYTKIGNMVTVQWSFRDVTTAGSFENAATKIHGLPFTAGTAKLSQGSVFAIYGGTSFSATPNLTRVDNGTTVVDVFNQSATTYVSPEIDAVGSGTYGGFTMTYWV